MVDWANVKMVDIECSNLKYGESNGEIGLFTKDGKVIQNFFSSFTTIKEVRMWAFGYLHGLGDLERKEREILENVTIDDVLKRYFTDFENKLCEKMDDIQSCITDNK